MRFASEFFSACLVEIVCQFENLMEKKCQERKDVDVEA